MSTIELVDPAAREMAQAFAAFDPTKQPLESYRAALAGVMNAAAPAEAPMAREEWAPSADGDPDVRLLVYRPSQPVAAAPAILFIHASGFIAGKPEWSAAANQALADQHGALVATVNYRLSPEVPFPGPLEDCYAALRWLHREASRLDVDPERIIVMGESAGGGLAAALAQLARDRGEFGLAGQVLIYPMLDPRTGTAEAPVNNPNAGEFIWTQRHNRFGWEAMRGGEEIDPERLGHFAPALAADVTRLPPTFIAVGALDLFAEEDAAYAMRLSRASVPVEFHLYPGGVHGFDVTDSRIARQYRADLSSWLTHALHSK